ncbi:MULTISPECIES: acyl-CoA carboxylase subunit epsilon [unclassified Streptomyces]|uniref:acyl-CoA carboxylase subunit epsilon n=1 Tax=unclassified Streptomyces TaxID=2593676 RepID=UPI00225B8020|nr:MULTISPECIES: acyl-CoA carboxylase subunit epsilon [unclassified Streptomyces]MCX5049428.1 acyl-CoA carboxylase subunit epsilon [Streptomyces sp. NBC_00474]MCX5055827.1 acyl-CoA carboxylase subunit epsilon [Streptomyces sp. NBC_00452]MCX5247314.1 acyl-CoA carboxylase subunit epsilon [Streptomyces sp. NBC_00201]MCX5286904.1 acyl-CoA carboxylase subunit epsilon [Streptomyces sp. NBC_00183]
MSDQPSFTIVRGRADPEDLAALVGVLLAAHHSAAEPSDVRVRRASWDRGTVGSRFPAGSWRSCP